MLIDIEIGTGFSIHILDLNCLEMPLSFYGTIFILLIFLNSSRLSQNTLLSQIFLCWRMDSKMSFGWFVYYKFHSTLVLRCTRFCLILNNCACMLSYKHALDTVIYQYCMLPQFLHCKYVIWIVIFNLKTSNLYVPSINQNTFLSK